MPITELASLATVKKYLRMPSPNGPSNEDETLQILMASAQQVVEKELGHIVAEKITAERHSGGKYELWLRELPVLYVENVEEGWGYYNAELDDQEVNQIPATSLFAYSLDDAEEGQLTRRSGGNVSVPFVAGVNNVRVDYVVGRTQIPPNAVHVFLELIAFWFRNSQLRAQNQSGTLGQGAQTAFGAINTDYTRSTGDTSYNQGIPEGLIELLRDDRRRPIIG